MEHILEAQYIICGVEVDDRYDGACMSVAKCSVEHEDNAYTNCIQIQYCATVESDATIFSQADINRLIMEEAEPLPQCFSLLLAHPSYLLCCEARIDGKAVGFESPPRGTPLGIHNLVARWNRYPPTSIQGYSSLMPRDSWPLLETMMSEFRKRPIHIRRQLTIPLRWFAEASSEMSGLDRLAAYWISFNSLYQNPETSEREAIRTYLRANLDTSVAHRYVQNNEDLLVRLSGLPIALESRNKKVMIAQELNALLKTTSRDHVSIIEKAALTIYGIRCNLFHGDYDPASDADQEHVDIAEHSLSPLLKEIIGWRILGQPLSTMRFATQHKLTF